MIQAAQNYPHLKFLRMCVNSHQDKLIHHRVSIMDDLFTFNSHQFQVIALHPPSAQIIRKRVISSIPPKRLSSVQSDSTTAEQPLSDNKSKPGLKKVEFSLIPPPQPHKNLMNDFDSFAEDSRKKYQLQPSNSNRYFGQLQNKRSQQLQRDYSCVDKAWPQNGISSTEPDQNLKRQRRLKSLRLAPKVMFPLSDRKLPKVFKKIGENYLPPLGQRQDKRRLGANLEIRETFSSQRARILLNYGNQLRSLNSSLFAKNQRLSTIPGV